MKITDEQALRLRERLESMRECPLCGARDYRISERFYALHEHVTDDGPVIVLPVAPIGCRQCGLLLLLSAHRHDLVPDGGQSA